MESTSGKSRSLTNGKCDKQLLANKFPFAWIRNCFASRSSELNVLVKNVNISLTFQMKIGKAWMNLWKCITEVARNATLESLSPRRTSWWLRQRLCMLKISFHNCWGLKKRFLLTFKFRFNKEINFRSSQAWHSSRKKCSPQGDVRIVLETLISFTRLRSDLLRLARWGIWLNLMKS